MQSKVMYLFLSAAGGRQWWHVCSYTLPITFFSTLFNLPKFFEFTTVRVQGRKTDADKKNSSATIPSSQSYFCQP